MIIIISKQRIWVLNTLLLSSGRFIDKHNYVVCSTSASEQAAEFSWLLVLLLNLRHHLNNLLDSNNGNSWSLEKCLIMNCNAVLQDEIETKWNHQLSTKCQRKLSINPCLMFIFSFLPLHIEIFSKSYENKHKTANNGQTVRS